MSKLEEKFLTAILEAGLPEPTREHVFHIPASGEKQRKWRFDFCYLRQKIAIEVEGGVFGGRGRHTRAIGFKNDCIKYNTAVEQGWQVYRFTTGMEKECVALLRRIKLNQSNS